MRIITMLFVLSLLSLQVFAGKITGKVSDEKTGETIIGATVLIKGTSNGTATDVDGNFALTAAAGTYTLEVKYIGYQTKEIDEVVVTESTPATLNIVISEANSTQLNEVVVRSSLKKENISALYTIQKNAATISDGISADVIRKSPDRSTGEVLKRVSGTTIQDNKFVIVRGLSDRYNTALIDNSILPSTEPNRKAFSFDIIPAAMIDNIVITKAATPDLPGDFAGGVINILTKETPDQNFNSVSVGLSYNTVSTGKEFQSGYRTKTDFLGFDDGSRQLPSSFPSTDKVALGLTPQEQISALSSMNNDMSIKKHSALPGLNLQAIMGRVYRQGSGNRFGFTGAVTYAHNESVKKDVIRQYDNFNYKDNIYIYSSNLGALLNAGYYFGSNKIIFKTVYNRIFDDNFLYRTGYNNSNQGDVRFYAFDLIQKSLLKTSLEGEHQIGQKQSKIGWILSYNYVTNNQPDQRKVSYTNTGSGYVSDNTSLGKANSRLFGDLKESILNGGINYSLPFNAFHNKSILKLGVFEQYRSRTAHYRYLGAVVNSNVSAEQQNEVRQRPIETLYANDMIQSSVYRLDELIIPGDNYDATASTSAAYAMLDNKLGEKFRMVWGVRFESYNLDLKAGDGNHINPVWNDLLPSANFTYALTDKSNLRASYFRSLARPELREIAPLSYYDYELNASFTGSTSLVRSTIDNIDLRYEIYPAAGEILSASVFYKKFDKTLEWQVYNANSSYDINPINFPSADNIGIELEIRKSLGFISKSSEFLRNLNFYANLAYIHSDVKLDDAGAYKYTSRALAGQSPYVINTSLGYTALDGALNLNVLYNRIGDRIFLVGQEKLAHIVESARNLLDFQASYSLSKKSEIRLNIKDLLNNPIRFYIDQDYSGKYEAQSVNPGSVPQIDKDMIYSEYRPGTTFSLTYSYKF